MSWNDLTFVECSLLTASQMTQLQGNFAALGAGMSGSPALSVNSIIWSGQGSGAALHVSSGIAAPQVSSLGTLHVSSGLILSQVASLGTVHAASGFVSPEASSFGMVHTASGFLGAETSSFGTVEVATRCTSPVRLRGRRRPIHFTRTISVRGGSISTARAPSPSATPSTSPPSPTTALEFIPSLGIRISRTRIMQSVLYPPTRAGRGPLLLFMMTLQRRGRSKCIPQIIRPRIKIQIG